MEAVKDFKDNSIDFVYIDGNHTYDYVTQDITEWSKKVRKGGIVSGHDYGWWYHSQKMLKRTDGRVDLAVKTYTHTNNIHPWFVLGRRKMIKGETRDSHRSWFFVKE